MHQDIRSLYNYGASNLPASFGGTMNAVGWVVLPNGLYIQWLSAAASAGGTVTLWPVAFPNAVYAGIATADNTLLAVQIAVSGPTFALTSASAANCFVMGIGH